MRQLSRIYLVFVSGLALQTVGFSAYAGSKAATLRSPASITRPAGKPVMNEKAWQSLNRAYLLKVVRDMNDLADLVKTKKDYERAYFSALRVEDRAYLERSLRGDYTPIRPKLEGNALIFEVSGETVRMEWPKVTEDRFLINGVEWRLHRNQPLAAQIELLTRRLLLAKDKQKSTAAFSLLFPAAEAGVISGTVEIVKSIAGKVGTFGMSVGSAGATAMVMGGGSGLIDGSCVISYEFLKDSWPSRCSTWKENLEKAQKKERENTSATVSTLERAKSKETDPAGSTDWIPSSDQSCPAAADDKRNVYAADMLQLQVTGVGTPASKVIPQNDWFALRVEFSADKKPKSGFLAPQGTDTSAPDAISKATDILVFDDRGFLKEIRYKNTEPAKPDDLTYKPMLTLDMNTDDTKLTPKEAGRRTQIRSLVDSLNGWIGFCMKKELIYKYIQQKKAGVSPQTNDVEAVNGRPVAPPTEPNTPSKTVQ